MERKDIDYVENLFKIAAAKGTKEQEKTGKTRQELEEILSEGCANLQSKVLMLEAFRVVCVGNKKIINKVISKYDELFARLKLGRDE